MSFRTNIAILPYKRQSKSAKLLTKELGIVRLGKISNKYTDRNIIINWGCTARPRWSLENKSVINTFEAVASASNKLSSLKLLDDKNVPIPAFTTSKNTAEEWLSEGHKVFCRTLTRASAGRGIHVAQPSESKEIPYAPLYTKHVKRRYEYRIHVFDNNVIDRSIKLCKNSDEETNWDVRTHGNGFIYAKSDLKFSGIEGEVSDKVALSAVLALGLDFGAVDLLKSGDRFVVLEVNTAPGIEASTLAAYCDVIKNLPLYEARSAT